jgi:hypothetical protein
MRQESPTGDYDRALEDERRANMTSLLILGSGAVVKCYFTWVRIFCGGRNPIDSADLIVQDLSGHPEGG